MFSATSFLSAIVAQAESAGPGRSALAGLSNLVPFVLMFAVLYFLVLRPANRQKREQAAFLAALKRDDEIVTTAGMCGRITAIDERVVTVEIADKVRVRLLRDRIAGRWADASGAAKTATAGAVVSRPTT